MGGGSQQVEVDGLRIAYERAGTGPPLVLLHGALADSRVWRRQLDSLAGDHTVVAWDAPGCGRSSDPPEDFRLADFADCLAGFVAALGLDRPAVLGLSFGGGLALALHRGHPRVAGSLVLASAYAGWAGSLPPDVVAQRLQRALREADMAPEELLPGWLPELLGDDAPAGLRDELLAIMSDFHPAGLRTMARAFAEADLRDVLPRIDVPTLVLAGDVDRRAPLEVARALHGAIPGSELVVLPGAGHLLNLDVPERFDDAVRAFLRSLAR